MTAPKRLEKVSCLQPRTFEMVEMLVQTNAGGECDWPDLERAQ